MGPYLFTLGMGQEQWSRWRMESVPIEHPSHRTAVGVLFIKLLNVNADITAAETLALQPQPLNVVYLSEQGAYSMEMEAVSQINLDAEATADSFLGFPRIKTFTAHYAENFSDLAINFTLSVDEPMACSAFAKFVRLSKLADNIFSALKMDEPT
ncbi:hypothetical protein V2G26_014270 [Clonostachys chloroleuca]